MSYPRTLKEACDYITEHVDTIFVSEEIEGEMGSHSLASLPGHLAVKHALRFIKEGRIPHRVLSEFESLLTLCPDCQKPYMNCDCMPDRN